MSLLEEAAERSQEEPDVRILFNGDDAVPCGRAEARPALNACEITVRPYKRTLKHRGTRRGHITSLPKEDGHVPTLR